MVTHFFYFILGDCKQYLGLIVGLDAQYYPILPYMGSLPILCGVLRISFWWKYMYLDTLKGGIIIIRHNKEFFWYPEFANDFIFNDTAP